MFAINPQHPHMVGSQPQLAWVSPNTLLNEQRPYPHGDIGAKFPDNLSMIPF